MSISVQNITKTFDDLVAVNDLSFQVSPGETYGLIGPNGAGKTTTLRMLACLMSPTNGNASICDKDVVTESLLAKKQLGFHTGSTGLYGRLRVSEVLRFFARLYGLSQAHTTERITVLADQLEFKHLLDRMCATLSTGEKQRVSLARAVVHDPMVLIFDEPTAGLDVLASQFVADFIRHTRDQGRAILFSTHYMTEAELLCDRIGLLYKGQLISEGTPEKIKSQSGSSTLEAAFLDLVKQRS